MNITSFRPFLALCLVGTLFGVLCFAARPSSAQDAQDAKALFEAARNGEFAAVKKLIEQGVDVNSTTQYKATALSYASGRGHSEIVEFLLAEGANPSTKDSFYNATPSTWAVMNGHLDILEMLLKAGAEGADELLQTAVMQGRKPVFEAILAADVTSDIGVLAARRVAKAYGRKELQKRLEEISVDAAVGQRAPTAEQLAQFKGTYAGDGLRLIVGEDEGQLTVSVSGQPPLPYFYMDENCFEMLSTRLEFGEEKKEGSTEFAVVLTRQGTEYRLVKGAAVSEPATAGSSMPSGSDESAVEPRRDPISIADTFKAPVVEWPSFRGQGARGISGTAEVPLSWDARWGMNVAWKTPVEGLALSCPVVWGERIYITTAISTEDKAGLRIGNYGDVNSVEDNSEHEFKLLCFDKRTGQLLWDRTSHVGVPRVKRHLKSSHANPTPATDGRYVVASFGSEGLYCYDVNGNLAWTRDFGVLDSGWFFDPSYQWGYGSSPIVSNGVVYIQCDIQEGSFVAALDLATGQTLWQTEREEIPTWSTPTLIESATKRLLVTNGSRAAIAYDARTGSEVWRIEGHSEIVVPTPFVANGRVIISSGYRPIQPIYAIDPNSVGKLDPKAKAETEDGEEESGLIWNMRRGGPYMPTPIAYRDRLYVCSNSGIVSCYDMETGTQVFRGRLNAEVAKSFVASPVAANGYLFLTSEQGAVVLLKASDKLEVVSENLLGESCLSTPAISEGMLFFRGEKNLIAIKQNRPPAPRQARE